ncbi:MAG TPA: methylenetetrahydrofolate--tRNA-(uracil(54)-C(5))-methyltransferase (FADH(2)-oxidizing) TrmFO [Pantanalinema sp.]
MVLKAKVIGGGLAGSEAAWQLAKQGISVELHEMRPVRETKAHHTDLLGELVCSNSLGAFGETSASGLLKAEMRRFDSLILASAQKASVPAGGALAVDRDVFAGAITEAIAQHPNITLVRDEVTSLDPECPTIIATGPLTSDALSEAIQQATGVEHLHFYDAAAPIVTLESLNLDRMFKAARWNKGEGVYLNCPMTREEYEAFHGELVKAEGAVLHLGEEEKNFFEGCLAVEVLARRGFDTLRYGPLKPVGLDDPRTGRWPYAVVQLRQDNVAGDLYNLVGFQTQLKWGEQKRVFRMIPGLEEAEFVRLGVMHRNTYLASPCFLDASLQWRDRPLWFVAGCLVGVEGYTESAASGALAGYNLARVLRGEEPLVLPRTTMLGSLMHYVSHADPKHFQPMNSNWGIIDPLEGPKVKDKQLRHQQQAERALAELDRILAGALTV